MLILICIVLEGEGGDIMANKRDTIMTVIIAFCLISTLFMMVQRTGEGNISAATNSLNSVAGYSPPYNVNVTNWPPTYSSQTVDVTYSPPGYFSPTFNCSGYSRMVLSVSGLSGMSSSVTWSVTLYAEEILWYAPYGGESVESLSTKALNVTFTVSPAGSVSWFSPQPFITETYALTCVVYWQTYYISSNAPSGWWISFIFNAYFRYD
jgi:hypothetical protein